MKTYTNNMVLVHISPSIVTLYKIIYNNDIRVRKETETFWGVIYANDALLEVRIHNLNRYVFDTGLKL